MQSSGHSPPRLTPNSRSGWLGVVVGYHPSIAALRCCCYWFELGGLSPCTSNHPSVPMGRPPTGCREGMQAHALSQGHAAAAVPTAEAPVPHGLAGASPSPERGGLGCGQGTHS